MTTPATQAHPIDMLREMLAREIERTSPTESFMIRSGLLADLLDELASLRRSHEDTAPTDPDLERHIFAWFNERDCDEMRACLEAYDFQQGNTHD